MEEKKTVRVEFAVEMSCDSCKSKIENVLKPLRGIHIISIDIPSQTLLLDLEASQQGSVFEMQDLIERETGLKAVLKGLGNSFSAVSEMSGNNNIFGVVRMSQLTGNSCFIDGVIDGIQSDKASLDMYEFGDLSGIMFENLGPVYQSLRRPLDTNKKTTSSFRFTIDGCDLSSCIGRSLGVRDNLTQKIMAAGIVARASPVGMNSAKKICVCSGKTLWEERTANDTLNRNDAGRRCHDCHKVYIFSQEDYILEARNGNESKFDQILKSEWNQAMKKDGVFRYLIPSPSSLSSSSLSSSFLSSSSSSPIIDCKILPGKYHFVAHFNEKRGLLRRKPQNMTSLKMPFDGNLFNFTKVTSDEILFKLDIKSQIGHHQKATIIVNNSPIEYGNSLLIPSLEKCQPQVLTRNALGLAISVIALSADSRFRIGFNSLGACASVNHLHFHMYYFDYDLMIDQQPYDRQSLLLKDWPIPGFVFELCDLTESGIRNVTNRIFQIIDICFEIELPHNLFITRDKTGKKIRVIVWPREADYGVKNDMDLATAFCEFSGFFICKTKESYNEISQDSCIQLLQTLDTKIDLILSKLNRNQ